jgi:hypothetical protein
MHYLTATAPRLGLLLFLWFGQLTTANAQGDWLEAQVLSGRKAVPHAIVQSVTDGKVGTVADSLGRFRLWVSGVESLLVTALGYADTTVQVSALRKSRAAQIQLRERPIALPELSIAGQRTVSFELGNRSHLVAHKNSPTSLATLRVNEAGGTTGAVFPIARKGVVREIHVYVLPDPEAYYVVSLAGLSKPRENYRRYPKDSLLRPLTKETFVLSPPKKAGWVTLDLSNYEIPLPPDHLVVLLNRVETRRRAKDDSEMVDYNIALQADPNKQIRNLYSSGGMVSIFARSDSHAAVAVSCEGPEEKKGRRK